MVAFHRISIKYNDNSRAIQIRPYDFEKVNMGMGIQNGIVWDNWEIWDSN